MGSARDTLTAALSDVLPAGLEVTGYARNIDPPDRPLVMVRIDRVAPARVKGRRAYECALVVVPTKSDPTGPADDELDAALEDVLHALDQADNLTWTSATRGTYQDTTYPAYEVAVTLPIVLAEPTTA